MWSTRRLNLVLELRHWAANYNDLMYVVQSSVNGSVAFFKQDIDTCTSDEMLLEMLHKRLDIQQSRSK